MDVDSVLRITSAANPLIKAVRKAARRGRATDDGLWLAESPHLLEEALAGGVELVTVLVAERAADSVRERAEASGAPVRLLDDELFGELATTEHSQGLLALVRPRVWDVDEIFSAAGPVIVLDQVADPGNLGTIARSAEAFGAAGLVLTRGSTRPDNPKALRASAGALFRLRWAAGVRPEAVVAACADGNRPLLAASAHEGRSIRESPLAGAAIVIGAEAQGVGPALAAAAEPIHIPTTRVESLNAAAAAAIILYQSTIE